MGDGHLKFMVELQARPAMIKEYNQALYDAKVSESNPYWDIVLGRSNAHTLAIRFTDKQAQ